MATRTLETSQLEECYIQRLAEVEAVAKARTLRRAELEAEIQQSLVEEEDPEIAERKALHQQSVEELELLIDAETSKAREAERAAAEMQAHAERLREAEALAESRARRSAELQAEIAQLESVTAADRKKELAQFEAQHAQQLEELQLSRRAQARRAEELRQRLEVMQQEEQEARALHVRRVEESYSSRIHELEAATGAQSHRRAQLEEELRLREQSEEAYAEELARLAARTWVTDLIQEHTSSVTQHEVFTFSRIKKLEALVGDAEVSRQTQMSRVEALEAQLTQAATTVEGLRSHLLAAKGAADEEEHRKNDLERQVRALRLLLQPIGDDTAKGDPSPQKMTSSQAEQRLADAQAASARAAADAAVAAMQGSSPTSPREAPKSSSLNSRSLPLRPRPGSGALGPSPRPGRRADAGADSEVSLQTPHRETSVHVNGSLSPKNAAARRPVPKTTSPQSRTSPSSGILRRGVPASKPR